MYEKVERTMVEKLVKGAAEQVIQQTPSHSLGKIEKNKMLNLRTCFVLKSYIHLILPLFAVVDPNLNFFLFSLATGINCSGGMHMFGCRSISRPKFGCYSNLPLSRHILFIASVLLCSYFSLL